MSSWNSKVPIEWQRKPSKLLIHVRGPGGKGLRSAALNGKKWDVFYGDTIIMPASPTKISIVTVYAQ